MRRPSPALATLPLAALLVAAPAAADPAPADPAPDSAADPARDPWAHVRRPWLYAADPTAPQPGHVIASLGVGYAQTNRGAARPFAADLAHAGAVFSGGAELGVVRSASIHAEGLLAGDGANVSAGAMLGASFYPMRLFYPAAAKAPVDLAVSAGYLRELGGDDGAWGRVAIAGDLGRLRLSFTALGEHVFAARRDGVDVLLTTGASYAVIDILRVGVEYVVQDLEGAWEPDEADGGIRHFIGPNASLELAKRVRVTAGPAFGLSQGSPTLLGRLAASYLF